MRRTESYLVAIHVRETTTYFSYGNLVRCEDIKLSNHEDVSLNNLYSDYSFGHLKEHQKYVKLNLEANVNSILNFTALFNEELNSPIRLLTFQNSNQNEPQKAQEVLKNKINYHSIFGYFLVLSMTLACYVIWLYWFNIMNGSMSSNSVFIKFFQCSSCTLLAFCVKSTLKPKISKFLLILSSIFIYFVIIFSYFIHFLSLNLIHSWILMFLTGFSISLLVLASIKLAIYYIDSLDRTMMSDQKHVLMSLAKKRTYSYKSKIFTIILLIFLKLDWSLLLNYLFETETSQDLVCFSTNLTHLDSSKISITINSNRYFYYNLKLITISLVALILTLFYGLFLVCHKEFPLELENKTKENGLKNKQPKFCYFLLDIFVIFFHGFANNFYRIILLQVRKVFLYAKDYVFVLNNFYLYLKSSYRVQTQEQKQVLTILPQVQLVFS
jgi:hypothetical protein